MRVLHRAARLLAIFAIPMLASLFQVAAAHAEGLEQPLARFAAGNFSETGKAITEIAQSGDPRAATILEALSARNLYVSKETKAVVIDQGAKQYVDAATGKNLASAPPALAAVRINNRLRGAIAAAIGTLTLQSPDPAARLEAADAIFKSRRASDLPQLEKAIAAEKNGTVKSALVKAMAAIELNAGSSSQRQQLGAVNELSKWHDLEVLGLLRQSRASADPELRDAIDVAVKKIEQHRQFLGVLQNIVYDLSLGSVLLLAAIGLAITFGVLGVINMAHGEMVMLGAYTTFVVQDIFMAVMPGAMDWSLLVALPAAFLLAGAVGIAIERGVIRFLYGRPLETLLATWGVSLILQQAIRTLFGPTNREVVNPSFMSGAFDLFGLEITWARLWIIVLTMLVFIGLRLALAHTRLGLEMRAVTQNRRMAASMGIRTARVDALTFGLGSGIAGIAGVALSQIDNVSPNLGQSYIVDSFMVVVFGGVGSLTGTLVSAFTLGVANKALEPVAGAVLAKILILVLLILFIQKRPRGLFALKGRAIEA
ncbi:MAG: urea ABC transporter permease subunit UrtB [Hyphomicrobiaceae bacterium]